MRRPGFTLVEFLVCVAVILVLAAILVPVLLRAKQSASERRSASNLRQLAVLINFYREEQGGGSAAGNPDEMALPVGDAFYDLWSRQGADLHATRRGPCAPFFDYIYYVPGYGGNAWENWARYSNKVEGQVVLMGDFTFNTRPEIEVVAVPKFGIGVFLDTSVKTKRRPTDPTFPTWWHGELP